MDHAIAVFTSLMLRSQVHSAVRLITDRVYGGEILDLQTITQQKSNISASPNHRDHVAA